MNILITGGFGYLGSYCAEYLSLKGNKVTIIGRKIPVYMAEWVKNFNVVIADITDEKLLSKLSGNKYDCVIHCAAANEVKCKKLPKESIEINTYGTENILNICTRLGIRRFIYVSTFHVYGSSSLAGTINEKSNIEASTLYGMTHYFGELLTKRYSNNYDMVGTSIRLANLCTGPLFKEIERWSIVPNNFISQAFKSSNIVINSSGNQTRNFLSIKDLCNAMDIIIKKQKQRYNVFNIGGERNYSINEIAEIVKSVGEELLKGKNIEIIHNQQLNQLNEEMDYVFDISKIKSIGYKPNCNIKDEIKETFEQFIESGV